MLAGIGCCLLKERLARAFALLLLAATVFLIFFPIAAYFVIGCLLYFARNCSVSVPRGVQSAVIVAWCVLAATIDHAPATFELQSLMMNVALAFTTVFFVVVSSRTGAFAWLATLKPIFFIGTMSYYSFYLTHPYSYFALRVLFQKLGAGDLEYRGSRCRVFSKHDVARHCGVLSGVPRA